LASDTSDSPFLPNLTIMMGGTAAVVILALAILVFSVD
jgi:hypothetical protein